MLTGQNRTVQFSIKRYAGVNEPRLYHDHEWPACDYPKDELEKWLRERCGDRYVTRISIVAEMFLFWFENAIATAR